MELRDFQQEIREIANKYALSIKEERLKENSVEELFREYRKTISDIIPISSETSRNVIFREFQCFVDYLQRICLIKRS